MTAIPVSAVIICANAQQTINACLSTLAELDEVVLYLNDSTDDTEQLAAVHPNVRIVHGTFIGFGPTKQAATALARNDWILSIDSDEWLDEALLSSIAKTDFADTHAGYLVLRKNRFCGQHVQRGGWGNDELLRLFNRNSARFNAKMVHEKIEPDATVELRLLDGVLWHDAVTSVDQFLQKTSRYSELAAEQARDKPAQHPMFALLRSHYAFFRSYVLQLGFLAGWRGIVIAFARATGTFFKYAKRYSKSRGFE